MRGVWYWQWFCNVRRGGFKPGLLLLEPLVISIVQNGYPMYSSEAMIICRITSRSKLGNSLKFY